MSVMRALVVSMAIVLAASPGFAAEPATSETPDAAGGEASVKTKKRRKAKQPKADAPVPAPGNAPTAAKPQTAPTVAPTTAKPVEAAKTATPGPARSESAAPAPGAPTDLLPELADTTPPSKLAITAFQVEGDEAPAALVYQLQDGFILGLVRAGVRVIDVDDLKNRLKDEPDLLTCDTSPCLKRLGQEVGVRHVARVQVVVTGNSYRMSARIYKTTGPAPAAMPVETQSRFCDVCTVTEAREAMLRLADGIRVPDEPGMVELKPTTVVVVAPSYRNGAIAAMVAGAAGIVVGTILVAVSSDGSKGIPVLGGGLMGAGAMSAVGGLYLYADGSRKRPSPPAAAPTE